jgi:putative phosphoserine phosphatase/1-acylglycerol-3-phosphate O-acyltransferase
MAPLVDAMKIDGKSVVLAPEGTRTISPKLAPFKKGAFHLAMQAGVPLVPVVIHNAGDVAPKGDFVYRRATVEVDVLPPVETSGWRVDSLSDRVREVRNMFARALGQPEEHASGDSAPAANKPAAKRKAAASKKAKPKAKAKAKTKTKTKTKTKPKVTTKAKAKPKAKPKAKAKAKPKARPKSDSGKSRG